MTTGSAQPAQAAGGIDGLNQIDTPASRYIAGHPLADVVLDLRSDQTTTLPRQFTGRRKSRTAGLNMAGSYREYRQERPSQILRWEDSTGFSCALVHTAGARGPIAQALPQVSHLILQQAGRGYRNVRDPQLRGEQTFLDRIDIIREAILAPAFTRPIIGVRANYSAIDSLVLRLGFAALGCPELHQVPLTLLTKTGMLVAERFQRAGFTSLDIIADWAHGIYDTVDHANSRLMSSSEIACLGEWGRATDLDTAITWRNNWTYGDDNGFRWHLPAQTCLDAGAAGFTPAMFSTYLCHGADATVKPADVTRNVRQWVTATTTMTPERACWYITAGIEAREARRLERSSDRPDVEALRFMGAMRDPTERPPYPDDPR